jgi:hypothetical protein
MSSLLLAAWKLKLKTQLRSSITDHFPAHAGITSDPANGGTPLHSGTVGTAALLPLASNESLSMKRRNMS